MSNLENNFSIYPYDYNELANKRALEESRKAEEQRRMQLADELSVDLGAVAMAAITGIAGPEYKEIPPVRSSSDQARKLGALPVSNVIVIDRPSFMNSLTVEQAATIDDRAMLGYAERTAA